MWLLEQTVPALEVAPFEWWQIVVVGLPAVVSIFAAIWAGRSAFRAQAAEHEATRLRALEERVAQQKYELYQPFLQVLGDMLTPGRKAAAEKRLEDAMANFQTFVTVWGSDDVVNKFFRYRISASQKPPTLVVMRLMSDFLIAVRKDIAWPETKLGGMQVIGMRINDLPDHPELERALTISLKELFAEQNWTPPFEV